MAPITGGRAKSQRPRPRSNFPARVVPPNMLSTSVSNSPTSQCTMQAAWWPPSVNLRPAQFQAQIASNNCGPIGNGLRVFGALSRPVD